MFGQGLELAGLHSPWPVANGAQVKYLDRYSNEDLREQYPELKNDIFVPLDYVMDGRTLTYFPDASFDFIIASHHFPQARRPRTLGLGGARLYLVYNLGHIVYT